MIISFSGMHPFPNLDDPISPLFHSYLKHHVLLFPSHRCKMGPSILAWLLIAARVVAAQSDTSTLTYTTTTTTTTTISSAPSTTSSPTSSTPTSQATSVASETGPLTLPISEYTFAPFPTPSAPSAPPSVFPATDPLSPPLVSSDPQVVPDFASAWAAAYDKAKGMVGTITTLCPTYSADPNCGRSPTLPSNKRLMSPPEWAG